MIVHTRVELKVINTIIHIALVIQHIHQGPDFLLPYKDVILINYPYLNRLTLPLISDNHFPLLVKVDARGRERSSKKRRSKMNRSYLPVEDITQDDLDNVADRASDKILDKENVRLYPSIHSPT